MLSSLCTVSVTSPFSFAFPFLFKKPKLFCNLLNFFLSSLAKTFDSSMFLLSSLTRILGDTMCWSGFVFFLLYVSPLFLSIYHIHSFSHRTSPLKHLVLLHAFFWPSQTIRPTPPAPLLTFRVPSWRLVEREAEGDDGSGLQDDESDVL